MPRTATPHAQKPDEAFEQELLDEILSLTPAACAGFLETLVGRMGYRVAQYDTAGMYRQPVGRTAPSIDVLAERPVPGGRRSVIVRLKRYHPGEPVFRRHVDELRGVALRSGAAEAVLVTTSTYPPSVTTAAYPSAAVVPVRLIDGAELARLCAAHRVGVWEEAQESPAEPVARGVEHAFFRSLGTAGPDRTSQAGGRPAFRLSVAVRVSRNTSCGPSDNPGPR